MTVLITGGTKGVGLALARRFAAEGRQVFFAYRQDAAAAAVAQIERGGGRAVALQADVGTPHGARRLIEDVAARTDRLDLVVHGAVKVLVGPLLDLDPSELAESITINGTLLVFLSQAALPLLRRGSRIVFLSSCGIRQNVRPTQ